MLGVILILTEIQVPQSSKLSESVLNLKDLTNQTGFTKTTGV